jgi:hypothetical protein
MTGYHVGTYDGCKPALGSSRGLDTLHLYSLE